MTSLLGAVTFFIVFVVHFKYRYVVITFLSSHLWEHVSYDFLDAGSYRDSVGERSFSASVFVAPSTTSRASCLAIDTVWRQHTCAQQSPSLRTCSRCVWRRGCVSYCSVFSPCLSLGHSNKLLPNIDDSSFSNDVFQASVSRTHSPSASISVIVFTQCSIRSGRNILFPFLLNFVLLTAAN